MDQTEFELLERRLARLETRLVQLMMHFGLNPYEKMHVKSNSDSKYGTNFEFNTQGYYKTAGQR